MASESPLLLLVVAADTPAVPVVGAGGESCGVAPPAQVLTAPVVPVGAPDPLDGPGIAGRLTEFGEPAVSLSLRGGLRDGVGEVDRLVSVVAGVVGELLPVRGGVDGPELAGLGVLLWALRGLGDPLVELGPVELLDPDRPLGDRDDPYGPFDNLGAELPFCGFCDRGAPFPFVIPLPLEMPRDCASRAALSRWAAFARFFTLSGW